MIFKPFAPEKGYSQINDLIAALRTQAGNHAGIMLLTDYDTQYWIRVFAALENLDYTYYLPLNGRWLRFSDIEPAREGIVSPKTLDCQIVIADKDPAKGLPVPSRLIPLNRLEKIGTFQIYPEKELVLYKPKKGSAIIF